MPRRLFRERRMEFWEQHSGTAKLAIRSLSIVQRRSRDVWLSTEADQQHGNNILPFYRSANKRSYLGGKSTTRQSKHRFFNVSEDKLGLSFLERHGQQRRCRAASNRVYQVRSSS